MAVKNLTVGAFGWQHSAWQDTYYPEDLPEDWQLDFYSHHFNVVLVPESEWEQASEGDIEQWTEDVSEGFEFLFAVSQASINEAVIKQLGLVKQITAQYFAGIVVTPSQDKFSESDVRLLNTLSPVYIDDTGASASGLLSCWRQGAPVENAVTGFISLKKTDTLRDVRACIEAFLAQGADQQKTYLIFEGDSPSIKTMQDSQIVIQMLT